MGENSLGESGGGPHGCFCHSPQIPLDSLEHRQRPLDLLRMLLLGVELLPCGGEVLCQG